MDEAFIAHLRTKGIVKIGLNSLGVITNLIREGSCSLGYNDIELMWETWQAAQDPVLDKPACVGNGTFQTGVKWSTVIGAAQRQYEYKTKDPVKPIISPADMLRVATGELVLVDVSKHIIIPKGTASGALND